MKKRQTLLISILAIMASSPGHTASVTPLWEPLHQQLKNYQLAGTLAYKLDKNLFSSKSPYELKFIYQNETNKIKHQRFQMRYQGLDIFGYHTLLHHYPNHKSMVTGHIIQDINKDILTTKAHFSAPQILQSTLKKLQIKRQTIKLPMTKKIVYIDPKSSKATLAYQVSFFIKGTNQPMLIVDANTGAIIKQWNNSKSDKVGTGNGGNSAARGQLTYTQTPLNSGELPAFEVTLSDTSYLMQSSDVEIRDFNDEDSDPSAFPIDVASEGVSPNPDVYSYTAGSNESASQAIDYYADGVTAYNTNNDSMFHAMAYLDMLTSTYQLSSPIGTDLPLRIYTRINYLDNAYSIATIEEDDEIISHQQLVIGGGNTQFYSMTLGVIAHEVGHNVTDAHSKMIYAEQSGAINEAFSDMSAIALNHELRSQGYTWYWDGLTYTIGDYITQNGLPFRYMSDPPLDGNSIGSAKDFVEGMNVHYSSGVFNKAFYNISVPQALGPQKTFQFMADANYNYWVPNNTYAYGACGVIQSAFDRGEDYTKVEQAFLDVDVPCKLFKVKKQVIKNTYS